MTPLSSPRHHPPRHPSQVCISKKVKQFKTLCQPLPHGKFCGKTFQVKSVTGFPLLNFAVSRHGGPLPSELNNPDGKHGVEGKVTTVMTSDDGYNLIKTPSPAKEEAVHVQQEKRRSFVDIKDVSTDSSVVSFSSNGSTTLNDTDLGQGPEGSPHGGQVTIIHHQQARRHQAPPPPPPAAVHRPAVTVSSGQANSNSTSVRQPLCVSALVTAGSNNPSPPSTEQTALDAENEASVEILAHL